MQFKNQRLPVYRPKGFASLTVCFRRKGQICSREKSMQVSEVHACFGKLAEMH
jgi:hypothetical protein